ncbi:hypothetical protein MRX96_032897 [Rhipicephalus microplus]
MLSYACCQYVVTRVTLYHSALVDLSRSRSVHVVEHEPCCPDPQLISANNCKAVHYGVCSPLLKLPSYAVRPASAAIIMAPQPPRPQSATSTVTDLSIDGLDPVELLAVDLEGKLEALVNSFVAQDKVKTAARKSKTAMTSSQASTTKKLASNQSTVGAGKFQRGFRANSNSPKELNPKVSSQQPSKPGKLDSGVVSKERKTVHSTSSPVSKPVIAVKPVSGNRNASAVTSAAMDYAKSRFQGLPEPKQFEELFKQKPCKNGHVVNDAKSRWESLTSPSSPAEQLWPNSVESSRSAPVAIPGSNSNHDLQAPDLDSPLSTSPRRLNSPEALFLEASSPPSIPHPRLTSSQKQHIRERSLSPTERVHMHVPVRPFLTKGSVAERVLLFERCPERVGLERTPAPAKASKQTVFNAWKQHHGAGDAHSGSQVSEWLSIIDEYVTL